MIKIISKNRYDELVNAESLFKSRMNALNEKLINERNEKNERAYEIIELKKYITRANNVIRQNKIKLPERTLLTNKK